MAYLGNVRRGTGRFPNLSALAVTMKRLIPAIIVLLLAVLTLLIAIYQQVRIVPPIWYSAAEYQPDKRVYAPGETLHFSPTLTMGHGGRVTGLRTIINATTHRVAWLCDGTPSEKIPLEANLDRGIYGDIMTGFASVAIPIEALPPGRYKVVTNINGYGDQAGEIGHDVFFEVRQKCNE